MIRAIFLEHDQDCDGALNSDEYVAARAPRYVGVAGLGWILMSHRLWLEEPSL
jgi:hypothetical protein|eukprot:SAG25_NODE_46_length_19040_cov_20.665699_15_plen_53_part_00